MYVRLISATLLAALLSMLHTGCRSTAVLLTSGVPESSPQLDYGDMQGWSQKERNWFYNTSQGSQLIRFDFMAALEQPDNDQPFLADEHIEKMRFIPRGFDPADPARKSQLPIGMVKDGGRNQFGFTCAACHTTQFEYGGKKLRIDGAGTLADTVTFLHTLTDAVKKTVEDPVKKERFVKSVLKDDAGNEAKRDKLFKDLQDYLEVRKNYDFRNTSTVKDGYARLDAFGRIFNKALWVANPKKNEQAQYKPTRGGDPGTIYHSPDSPVSYPFLWGTDQSDFVQWVGLAPNANVGSLGRNVGEVLGVFATVDYEPRFFGVNFPSSARMHNLISLEQSLRHLHSPSWESFETLPPIDGAKLYSGKILYQENCVRCHNPVQRKKLRRKVVDFMQRTNATPDQPDAIGTDRRTASNIVYRTGQTGILKTLNKRSKLKDEESMLAIVSAVGKGMVLTDLSAVVRVLFHSVITGRGLKTPDKVGNAPTSTPAEFLAYKGRSLNGAWATAPYLHNGSVPNMWELLQPPAQRAKTFRLGSREFDPVNMGLKNEGDFVFDTSQPNNSNAGHNYGTGLTEDEKWAIIEYMKTDMNP